MDPDSRLLDYRDRAASSEPASTRPNPFDDTDNSSRKRRRTSMSGSPTKSVDIVKLITDSPSSGTLDGDATVSETTEPTKIDTDSISPQTPEHPCSSTDAPTEAPSSMVTINLRKIPDDEVMSSPISPTVGTQEAVPQSHSNEIKHSVEPADLGTTPASALLIDTPQSSSLHDESPPVEIVTVQADDDMDFVGETGYVPIIEQDRPLVDPIQQFPYKEPDESLVNTLRRLTTYLQDRTSHHLSKPANRVLSHTEPNIEDNVLESFQQWLDNYVKYIQTVDIQTARTSCQRNRDFWISFPEVIYTMLCRRFG